MPKSTHRTWIVNESPRHFLSVMARIVRVIGDMPNDRHRLVCRQHPSVDIFSSFFDQIIFVPHERNPKLKEMVVPDYPEQVIFESDVPEYFRRAVIDDGTAKLHYNQIVGQGMKLDGEQSLEFLWDELANWKFQGYRPHIGKMVRQNWEFLSKQSVGRTPFIAPADPLDTILDYYPSSLWEKLLPTLRHRDFHPVTWESLWKHHPDQFTLARYAYNQETPSIWEQLWALATSSMFIGFESWLAHVAVSMGIPSFILFPVESWQEQWEYSYPWVHSFRVDRKTYDPQGIANVILSWTAQAAEGKSAVC